MIEYRCPACEARAFSAASELRVRRCPSCGTQLGEGALASGPQPAPPGEMNLSVWAARRERATTERSGPGDAAQGTRGA
jgi:ribosomal protein L37AE/L43A